MWFKRYLAIVLLAFISFAALEGYADGKKPYSINCKINITINPARRLRVNIGETRQVTVDVTVEATYLDSVGILAEGYPDFAQWNDYIVKASSGDSYHIQNVMTVTPPSGVERIHEFRFIAYVKRTKGYKLVYRDTVDYRIQVYPMVLPEPLFTQGTTNTIFWVPGSDELMYDQKVLAFDPQNPGNAWQAPGFGKWLAGETRVSIFENLCNGCRYGYYVEAYLSSGQKVYSDTVYSTQDASPPAAVSDTWAFPDSGGSVVLQWSSVVDTVSSVRCYYIYRRHEGESFTLLDSVEYQGETNPIVYRYQDWSKPNEGEKYFYKVRAVDVVSNIGEGIEVGPVIPDASPPLKPIFNWKINLGYDYFDSASGKFFVKGAKNSVWILDPRRGEAGLKAADSVRFQAAREEAKFFDDKWQPGVQFFTSEWLPIQKFALDSIHYTFDFSNGGTNEPNFINGHTYLYRVQTKDLVGNLSPWSRIDDQANEVKTIPDLFPAEDVPNLMIDVVKGTNATDSYMLIHWDPVNDPVSGLKEYLVFRKKGTGGTYEMVATVPAQNGASQISYQDSFASIDTSTTIYYRIGSRDHVGNCRDFDDCAWEVGARCLLGPKVKLQATTKLINGSLFTTQTKVILDWSGYDLANVIGFVALVNGSQMQVGASTTQIQVDIHEGLNRLAVKALFDDGRESLWSDTLQVWRDTTPPPPVSWVKVENDSGYQGNMHVHWSPSSDPAGVFYRIYRQQLGAGGPVLWATTSDTFWTDYYEAASLRVYQTYKYIVYPADSLGNFQMTGTWDSNYCNKPPIITHLSYDQEYSKLSINWHTPPYPDSSAVALRNLRFDVKCFQDSLPVDFIASSYYKSQSVVGDTAMWFNVEPNHDYYCVLRGVELRSGRYDSTNWAKPKLVEAKLVTDIPGVTNLYLQPQPTDTTGIFISWESYWQNSYWTAHEKKIVDFFRIIRTSDTDTLVRDFTPSSAVFTSAQFMDREDLVPLAKYTYQVIPFEVTQNEPPDSLFPETNVVATVINDTDRVFIPQIDKSQFSFHPQKGKYYFRSEQHSIRVEWRWLDNQGVVFDTSTHNTRGAQIVQVEAANNSDFLSEPSTGKYAKVKNIILDPSTWDEDTGFYHTYFRELNSPQKFNIYDGDTLFLRIKGLDRWGHDPKYPSSVKWDGVVSVILDDTPPPPISLTASSRAVTSPDSNKVDLILSWNLAIDLISGVKNYKIFLDSLKNGNYINVDSLVFIPATVKDTSFSNITISKSVAAEWRVRIVAEDWAGNQQRQNSPACFKVLPAPKLLAIKMNSDSTITAVWSKVANSDHYYIEYVDSLQFLGNPALRISPENHRITTDTSYTWPKDYFGNKRYYFHLAAISPTHHESGWSNVDSLKGLFPGHGGVISEVEDNLQVPSTFQLCQNYPNPFPVRLSDQRIGSVETIIEYHLPSTHRVTIRIFNTLGQVVRTLVDEQKEAGIYLVRWDGRNESGQDVASGIYFYVMNAGNYRAIKKALLLR